LRVFLVLDREGSVGWEVSGDECGHHGRHVHVTRCPITSTSGCCVSYFTP
jgi:hypothetical protein